MAAVDFASRKALGTGAEIALRDLLTQHGAIVTANQINHDVTRMTAGAALAHLAGGQTLHMPDLSAVWPAHPIRRFGCEVKAKSPLGRGGWGWDTRAFTRACRWSQMAGDPVYYVIRDLSAAPLPAPGVCDHPDYWCIASVWKLQHSPSRVTDDAYHYWPATDFVPLAVLLSYRTEIAVQAVAYLPQEGDPPVIL